MKYIFHSLDNFEFHDAVLHFYSCKDETLTLTAKYLNVHHDVLENKFDCDMEIELAEITFKHFHVKKFEPPRSWKCDKEGNYYTDDPLIQFFEQEASEHFTAALHDGLIINCFDRSDDADSQCYEISGSANSDFINAVIRFDSVTVSWTAFAHKAWYELHHDYDYPIVLGTHETDFETKVHIMINEEDLYNKENREKVPIVNVAVKYYDVEYLGHGHDFLWVDAFADLQRNLPDGIFLKCCLTCRHGNMCPVGNTAGEVFCTKDLTINRKEDLFYCTEDKAERDNRSRKYSDCCNDYVPQSKEHFAYNDYPYELNKSDDTII